MTTLFTILILMTAIPAFAQDTMEERLIITKDPATATLFSLFMPGAGHFYARESGTGATLLVGSIASSAIGYGLWLKNVNEADRLLPPGTEAESVSAKPVFIGAGISTIIWLYGVIDAHKAAHRYNEQNGLALQPIYQEIEGHRVFGASLRIPL